MNSPPFLVSFSSVGQFLKALPDDVRAVYAEPFQDLVEKGLPPVVSIRCLATLFGYSPRFIGALSHRTKRYYRTFSILKGKKKRIIHAPKVALKVIQKWFGFHLARALEFNEVVFGFIEGRSPIGAAEIHCEADWVYSVDIENFFDTTPLSKVTDALIGLGYSRHGAELIGGLCCYGGMLAQGSPASPVLSNLVFRDADDEFISMAKKHEIRYSRYADDIVFSGKGQFPIEIKRLIRTTVESRGWKMADNKERLAVQPNRLKVHGLLVHGRKPRLTKGYRNRIRAFKYLIDNDRVDEENVATLRGHISYSNSVDKVG